MTVLAVHRQQPNWPADPKRPIFPMRSGEKDYWVETDGPEPSEADLLTVIAPAPSPQTIIEGVVFLDRFTDAEYDALRAKLATNVRLARWLEALRMRNKIDVNGAAAQTAKSGLVTAGVLTAQRADVVFAAS